VTPGRALLVLILVVGIFYDKQAARFGATTPPRRGSQTRQGKAKTGPKPERLKLKGEWEALVGKALKKKRPKKGWPKA